MVDFASVERAHQQAIASVFSQSATVGAVTDAMIHALKTGNKVLWCGNGGSAAEAQHMSAELMVRYVINRRPLASIALTTDTSLLTAHSNDFEFASVFSRQIAALGQAGDMLVAISTSGHSANVLQALQQAKQQGLVTFALTGQGPNPLAEQADFAICIDSTTTARIQEAHTLVNHLICEGLDLAFNHN
jgi:D-sedoheptulose 7-phosphate isomerase